MKKLAVLAIFANLLVVSPALAADATVTHTDSAAENSAEAASGKPSDDATEVSTTVSPTTKTVDKTMVDSARCKFRDDGVSDRESVHDDVSKKVDDAFSHAEAKLSAVIALAQAQSIDVTKLQADLTALKTKQAKLMDDRDAAKAQLDSMMSAACSASLTDWKASVTKYHTLVKQVIADIADVKTFYSGTVKVDLKAVRDQLKAAKPSDTNVPDTKNSDNSRE